MNTKSLISSLCVALFSCASTYAASSLQFSNVGRLTGFSAHGDVDGTDGLRWAIIIDTAGNGFADLTTPTDKYDAFNNTASGFLSIGGTASDDYYYTSAGGFFTSTSTALGLDPGGVGTVLTATGTPNGSDVVRPAGVDTNDPFAIIWFDGANASDGSYYGVFTHASFLLPSSGSLVSFSSPFNSATLDPIKQANIQIGATPEPSRALLLGFGALGLMFRRRRA